MTAEETDDTLRAMTRRAANAIRMASEPDVDDGTYDVESIEFELAYALGVLLQQLDGPVAGDPRRDRLRAALVDYLNGTDEEPA